MTSLIIGGVGILFILILGAWSVHCTNKSFDEQDHLLAKARELSRQEAEIINREYRRRT